jgi:HNH endonuclease
MGIIREERIARLFESRVVEILPSGCHIWMGGVNGQGYGLIRDGLRHKRAHRMAWEMVNGPTPEGMVILHSCDVPSCVNPHHLTAGTQADNLKDMRAKGRGKTPNVRGERQGSAKLTADDVREIRRMQGRASSTEVAARFNVHDSNVRLIWRRKGWAHVDN